MVQTNTKIPGDLIGDDKNRSELQSVLRFSIISPKPSLSISDPTITFTLSARQTWSAHPSLPLTISTRHTPLNASVLGRKSTGEFLERELAILEHGLWQRPTYMSPLRRQNFKNPRAEDWQEELGFITIPSLDSGDAYVIDRTARFDAFETCRAQGLVQGQTLQFRLDDTSFLSSPGIEWWNWGDLEGELKGKKLGYRGDPLYNDKDREEERKYLPADLVLGYDNWRDVEDDEGNQMVRLEVRFDTTPVTVEVVD